MNARIPAAQADILHWTGMSWTEVAADLNRRYGTRWQGTSVAGAVYRWRKERRQKLGKFLKT